MSLFSIFYLLLLHWVADFICQTDWEAKNKSTNNEALISHTSMYSIITFGGLIIYAIIAATSSLDTISVGSILLFTAVTFVTHTFIDYYTSRVNSYFWQKKDSHNFFVSVGFDQVLHYVQLFLCFKYIL
jgi:hypothetical protein